MNQKTAHGTIEITAIMYSGTQRKEFYTSNETGDRIAENCHVVNVHDHSPRAIGGDVQDPNYRRYDSACSYCYLGFTHSINAHDQAIKGA
jgi:hypothetical protein